MRTKVATRGPEWSGSRPHGARIERPSVGKSKRYSLGGRFAAQRRGAEQRGKLRYIACQKSPMKAVVNAAPLPTRKAAAKRGISGGKSTTNNDNNRTTNKYHDALRAWGNSKPLASTNGAPKSVSCS